MSGMALLCVSETAPDVFLAEWREGGLEKDCQEVF